MTEALQPQRILDKGVLASVDERLFAFHTLAIIAANETNTICENTDFGSVKLRSNVWTHKCFIINENCLTKHAFGMEMPFTNHSLTGSCWKYSWERAGVEEKSKTTTESHIKENEQLRIALEQDYLISLKPRRTLIPKGQAMYELEL